jgi:putative DNA-invertase from lambdoid prophage Rac
MTDLGGDTTGNRVSSPFYPQWPKAERDRTRERVTEVKRDQRQRGRYLGGIPPFGGRVGSCG